LNKTFIFDSFTKDSKREQKRTERGVKKRKVFQLKVLEKLSCVNRAKPQDKVIAMKFEEIWKRVKQLTTERQTDCVFPSGL